MMRRAVVTAVAACHLGAVAAFVQVGNTSPVLSHASRAPSQGPLGTRPAQLTCRVSSRAAGAQLVAAAMSTGRPDNREHKPNPNAPVKEKVADTRHEGKTIGRKEARKIFESVLKASKTGAKGTHVRALMNPMSSTYDDKFPAAWAQLTKDEQKEVIRKQDQQIATVKVLNMATKTQKKQEQLVKRAKKKFDAIDTDGSGDITLDEMKAAMLGHEYVGSFGARDVTMHDVIRRFNDMDVNKDGAISLTEFQAGLARESQAVEESFWGSFHAKDVMVMDLQRREPQLSAALGSVAQAIVDDAGPDVVKDALTRLNALAKESGERMQSSGDSFQGQTDLEEYRNQRIGSLREKIIE